MPEIGNEYSPLSGLDEYMVHQTPDPLRVMWTDDPRAYERYWFVTYDKAGQLLLIQGLGFYPNLGTAEAFCIVVYQGQHTTVRAHRLLRDDRMDMRLGPLNVEVIAPFRDIRLTLGENQQRISYDLHFRDTKRAVALSRAAVDHQGQPRSSGGYETFGNVEGWLEYKGTRIELKAGLAKGTRDHHWGVRNGVGGPAYYQALEMPPGVSPLPGFIGGPDYQEFEFPDWSLWISRVLYNLGDPRPGAGPRVVQRERKLKFHPMSKAFLEGIVWFTLDDGHVKQVHFKRLKDQIACLRCGMYPQGGGTPDRGIWQGMYVGDDVVEGETYDLTDPRVLATLNGLQDNQCLVTCDGETTVGLFESITPTLYEYCCNRIPGYSLLE